MGGILDSFDEDTVLKNLSDILKDKKSIKESLQRVLFDISHFSSYATNLKEASEINPTHPEDSSYSKSLDFLDVHGFNIVINRDKITENTLRNIDIVILPHNSSPEFEFVVKGEQLLYSRDEIDNLVNFVKNGGGLLLFGESEINKYGNNLNDLLREFDGEVKNNTLIDRESNFNNTPHWPKVDKVDSKLYSNVKEIATYRGSTLKLGNDWEILAISKITSNFPNEPVISSIKFGEGRVLLFSDSDLFSDDSIEDLDNKNLFLNSILYLIQDKKIMLDSVAINFNWWEELKIEVNKIRKYQNSDGSVKDGSNLDELKYLLENVIKNLENAKLNLINDKDYLDQSIKDLNKWREEGYKKPDFTESLKLFNPNSSREDGRIYLSLFPMYTQNGNKDTNFEAVLFKVYWPDWLSAFERNGYDNPGFLTIEFIDYTEGYNTNSAVLFPETVSISEKIKFNWGAIFADRESARFNKVISEASKITKLDIPLDLNIMLNNNKLSREVFALWDLIHDRTHMHGDLPFDPFMIKQRMPFWMYGLEELRCDLNAYIEADKLAELNILHGKLIKYAIIYDRIFRFSVTGERNKNYDSLAGQLLFSKLHKSRAINWRDNILTVDYDKVDSEIRVLRDEIEELYRNGINMSKLNYWISAYDLVTRYLEPDITSEWRKGIYFSNIDLKDLLNKILPDEFPLNLFHTALKNKLEDTIESCKGINGKY